jgi:hypothetical protein
MQFKAKLLKVNKRVDKVFPKSHQSGLSNKLGKGVFIYGS